MFGAGELSDALRSHFGDGVDGHDAFDTHLEDPSMFEGTPNLKTLESLMRVARSEPLVFIGYCSEINISCSLTVHASGAEGIYGLPILFDEMAKIRPGLLEKDCSLISKTFSVEACLSTFVNDCVCCG